MNEIWHIVHEFVDFENNFLFYNIINKKWYEKRVSSKTSLSQVMKSTSRIQETLDEKNGKELLKKAWDELARTKDIDFLILRFLIDKKIQWDPTSVVPAVLSDNFDYITYIHKFGKKFDSELVIDLSALRGNLDFMKKMYKLGFIPGKDTSYYTWLFENGIQ